jgi:hypothetical protein
VFRGHILGMAIQVLFSCPRCLRLYKASQDLLGRAKQRYGRFDCPVCHTLIHSWAGSYDYSAWALLDPQKPRQKTPVPRPPVPAPDARAPTNVR